jgi:hypothetical protein
MGRVYRLFHHPPWIHLERDITVFTEKSYNENFKIIDLRISEKPLLPWTISMKL